MSNIVLGAGLLAGAFMVASAVPASGWALGGFLCFFTLGVTLIVEGLKKRRRKRQPKALRNNK